MKKIILFILVAFNCHELAAQFKSVNEIPAGNSDVSSITIMPSVNSNLLRPATGKDHAYYQEKSRKQRTAGLVLLGSGVLLSGVGLIISTRNDASFDQTETGITVMGVGAAAGIASIPFMILAHVNRNKARVMLSSQKTSAGIPYKYGKGLASVTVSIPLGK